MVKKVLKSLKNFFIDLFIHRVEKYENCVWCGKKLKGRQRKLCSPKCANSYWRKRTGAKPYQAYRTEKEVIK